MPIKAVRTTLPNGKRTIVVTLTDGAVKRLGGERATTATCVIVSTSARYGLQINTRTDEARAQAEAAKMRSGYDCKVDGVALTTPARPDAIVVHIEED